MIVNRILTMYLIYILTLSENNLNKIETNNVSKFEETTNSLNKTNIFEEKKSFKSIS